MTLELMPLDQMQTQKVIVVLVSLLVGGFLCIGVGLYVFMYPQERSWTPIQFEKNNLRWEAKLKTKYRDGRLFYQLEIRPIGKRNNYFDSFDFDLMDTDNLVRVQFYDSSRFKVDGFTAKVLSNSDSTDFAFIGNSSCVKKADVSWEAKSFELERPQRLR